MNNDRELYLEYRSRFVCDLLKYHGRTKVDSIADFGCGDGRLLAALTEKLGAAHAIGVDLDADPNRSSARIRYHRANFLDFTPDQRCELVTSIQVFEHVHEPWLNRYFDALKRACKPGGMILISTPNRWRPSNLVRVATLRRPAMMYPNPGIPGEEFLGHHRESSYREMAAYLDRHFSSPEWRFQVARTAPRSTGSLGVWMINLAIYCGLWLVWRPLCVSASHDHYAVILRR